MPDAEFVEFAAAPGAMRVEDLELTALDEHRVLAAFRIRMRGTGSGAETSMRIFRREL